MKVLVVAQHSHKPVMVRVWEVVGSESEFPFIAAEWSLN